MPSPTRRSVAAFLRGLADGDADVRRMLLPKTSTVAECAREVEVGLGKLEAILSGANVSGCACSGCAAIAADAPAGCPHCGSNGPPVGTPCACPEGGPCPIGSEEGCGVHGTLLCPTCGGGELDGYDLVRSARGALEEIFAALEPE